LPYCVRVQAHLTRTRGPAATIEEANPGHFFILIHPPGPCLNTRYPCSW